MRRSALLPLVPLVVACASTAVADEARPLPVEPRSALRTLGAATVGCLARDIAPKAPKRGPSHRPNRVDDPSASLAFVSPPGRVTLVEGADGEVLVPIAISRGCGTPRPVTLSLDAVAEEDERYLSHRFEREKLAADESGTRLALALRIGMAPLTPHTRELLLRADDGRSVIEMPIAIDVEPTEADDVYLLIGQSNMVGFSQRESKRAGSGEPDEPHERIRQLNVFANDRARAEDRERFVQERDRPFARFTRAEDPLHQPRRREGRRKSGTSIGPALSFAKAMLPHTTRDIYLVPAAWSATGFCDSALGDLGWNAKARSEPWLGGSLLLERALDRLDRTLRETDGVLRGILWHQGRADSNDRRCAETYAENLVDMIGRLRSDARVDRRGPSARGSRAQIPFVAATMSKGRDERGDYRRTTELGRYVDDTHRDIASLVPYADFVNADDLVPPAYPCGRSSCVHFGAAALRVQGERFAEAIRRIVSR